VVVVIRDDRADLAGLEGAFPYPLPHRRRDRLSLARAAQHTSAAMQSGGPTAGPGSSRRTGARRTRSPVVRRRPAAGAAAAGAWQAAQRS
jgi:hypothetical protein